MHCFGTAISYVRSSWTRMHALGLLDVAARGLVRRVMRLCAPATSDSSRRGRLLLSSGSRLALKYGDRCHSLARSPTCCQATSQSEAPNKVAAWRLVDESAAGRRIFDKVRCDALIAHRNRLHIAPVPLSSKLIALGSH